MSRDEYEWLRSQGYTEEMIELHKALVKSIRANSEFQRLEAEETARILGEFEKTPAEVGS